MASATRKKAVSKPRQRKVTFGSVTVLVDETPKAEKEKNIRKGQDVLVRLLEAIQTPGVDLVFEKDVPYYHADPENPSRLIRVLNGEKEPVIFKDGDFVVCT
jgi:hypothetical protein